VKVLHTVVLKVKILQKFFRQLLVQKFPAIKARRLYRILTSEPLNFILIRSKPGSHRVLENQDGKKIIFAWHDNREISGFELRNLFVMQLGISDTEARRLLK